MQYIRTEKALAQLVGDPEQKGRFHQTASLLKKIMNDKNLSPDEKKMRIADIIESGIQ